MPFEFKRKTLLEILWLKVQRKSGDAFLSIEKIFLNYFWIQKKQQIATMTLKVSVKHFGECSFNLLAEEGVVFSPVTKLYTVRLAQTAANS